MNENERFWVLLGVFVFIIAGGSRLAITWLEYFINHYDENKIGKEDDENS